MCDRIAQILKLRGSLEVAGRADIHPADARELEMDVLRSEAIGVLANPVRALALLRWAEQHDRGDMPDEEPPTVVLDSAVDPEAYRPPATLYVHMSQEAFRGGIRGAARVEGVGPVTCEQAVDLLRHCHVSVRPVVDLNANPSADGYEVSPAIREIVQLRSPIEVFPHGTLASRSADLDHVRAYRWRSTAGPPGPPAQTAPDNLGPLGRFHHRVKTHGGWQCHQPTRGVYYWRSPHGHWARVDAHGTTYLGASTPLAIRIRELRDVLGAPADSVAERMVGRLVPA
jgi:hypothetical protein